MKYVFGPIPSRRLGRSLGIDPVPLKTCNWNCVYCQLGRTSALTTQRHDYFPPDEIIAEVKTALRSYDAGQIDWLTFAGSGEPTLHASLGRIIAELKESADVPMAVITNGSLLYIPEVRASLMPVDAVLPTLDAGSERLYQQIDRPLRELTFARLMDGLIAFRKEFRGSFWLEVVLIRGMNDSIEALADLADAVQRIAPDQVHINLPIRPPAMSTVEIPTEESVRRACDVLGRVAEVVHPVAVSVQIAGHRDLGEAICEMVRRHPMSREDLCGSLCDVEPEELDQLLQRLTASGQVRELVRHDTRFWASAESLYAAQR
ncbi:MAG: radical SAM protein [Planctomycetia bacterium]|nr:radical SAM protein [Planctomycetia bacterium]